MIIKPFETLLTSSTKKTKNHNMQTASPYNNNKSKTSCLHVPAYVFLGIFLCDFVRENSLEKNAPTTFLI